MAKKQKTIGKLTQSAKGEDCTLQIHPYCRNNPDYTVPCHMPCEDKGWAFKSPDWWLAYGCDKCHAIVDGGWVNMPDLTWTDILEIMLRGIYRTQKRMREKGLISDK